MTIEILGLQVPSLNQPDPNLIQQARSLSLQKQS